MPLPKRWRSWPSSQPIRAASPWARSASTTTISNNPEIPIQQAAFIAQMKIAAAARKPITIHCRTSELAIPAAKAKFGPADAWEDILALIAEHWTPTGLPGIMHCFSGDQRAGRAISRRGLLSLFRRAT